MAVVTDIVIILHSLVVMVAIQYALLDNNHVECHTNLCNSLHEEEASLPWKVSDPQMQCSCCKFTKRHFIFTVFTSQAVLHTMVSILTVLLKHRVFRLPKYLWVYVVLIVIAVINAFYITRLFGKPTIVNETESVKWSLFTAPFRFTRTLVSTIISTTIRKLISEATGLNHWLERDTIKSRVHICSLNHDDVIWDNNGYILVILSWSYIVSTVFNIYILINCMINDKQIKFGDSNNNYTKSIKYTQSQDQVDNVCYSSDEDSFVLGWRL